MKIAYSHHPYPNHSLAPAKINLCLHVIGKRPDNYHDIVSVMCPVALFDIVFINFNARSIQVSCSDASIAQNEQNLGYKAAELFFDRLEMAKGVDIFILKNIPTGAGLGGGSSDAATVLKALNRHYDNPFSQQQLIEMGSQLGADVPFFILGKPAVATGIGDQLETLPPNSICEYAVVLVYPGIHVATSQIYKKLNLGLTSEKKALNNTFFKNRYSDMTQYLINDLEWVTLSDYPEISDIKSELIKLGSDGALMTGSGSAVFGLFADYGKAQNAANILSQHPKWVVWLTFLLTG